MLSEGFTSNVVVLLCDSKLCFTLLLLYFWWFPFYLVRYLNQKMPPPSLSFSANDRCFQGPVIWKQDWLSKPIRVEIHWLVGLNRSYWGCSSTPKTVTFTVCFSHCKIEIERAKAFSKKENHSNDGVKSYTPWVTRCAGGQRAPESWTLASESSESVVTTGFHLLLNLFFKDIK